MLSLIRISYYTDEMNFKSPFQQRLVQKFHSPITRHCAALVNYSHFSGLVPQDECVFSLLSIMLLLFLNLTPMLAKIAKKYNDNILIFSTGKEKYLCIIVPVIKLERLRHLKSRHPSEINAFIQRKKFFLFTVEPQNSFHVQGSIRFWKETKIQRDKIKIIADYVYLEVEMKTVKTTNAKTAFSKENIDAKGSRGQ